MTDLTIVAALERRMFNAWPAIETMVAENWIARWANGYTKRANSASALSPGADADDALITAIETWFGGFGGRVCFRLSPLASPDLDARLAARGYEFIEPTCVMLAPLAARHSIDPRVQIEPVASAEWLAANSASYGGEKADAGGLSAIVSRIRVPAAFATLRLDGVAVAWGIAAAERGFVALQDIVVDPTRRGGGLGRALVTSLLAWGRRQGADRAYLQVRDTNSVARALYASLGFTDRYVYTHRVKC